MDSTRPRNVRQAIIYMRELDAAADRIDSTVETVIIFNYQKFEELNLFYKFVDIFQLL